MPSSPACSYDGKSDKEPAYAVVAFLYRQFATGAPHYQQCTRSYEWSYRLKCWVFRQEPSQKMRTVYEPGVSVVFTFQYTVVDTSSLAYSI